MFKVKLSDFKKNAKTYLREVEENSEVIQIKRNKSANVVVLSLDAI